jgi:hypothetical protein
VMITEDEMTEEEWEVRYCTQDSQADHAHPRPTERL